MANRETLSPGGHQSFAAAIFAKIKTLLAGKQDTLTFDAAPTPGSQNPVTSSGVASAINALTASDVGALPDDQIVPITLGGTGNADGYIRTGLRADTTAGSRATAEGNSNRASGRYSHAEGTQNSATHDASHAEGQGTSATALYAHAEGYSTRATRQAAHAEGYNTYASGNFSHAEGQSAVAYGASAHAEGTGTNASGENQHVGGKYNVVDNANAYAEIIGNGTGSNARSNARTLDWAGNSWQAGKATVGAQAVNDMDLPPLSQVREMIGSGGGGGSLPAGGTTGQVLTKRSATDGDADWADSGVDALREIIGSSGENADGYWYTSDDLLNRAMGHDFSDTWETIQDVRTVPLANIESRLTAETTWHLMGVSVTEEWDESAEDFVVTATGYDFADLAGGTVGDLITALNAGSTGVTWTYNPDTRACELDGEPLTNYFLFQSGSQPTIAEIEAYGRGSYDADIDDAVTSVPDRIQSPIGLYWGHLYYYDDETAEGLAGVDLGFFNAGSATVGQGTVVYGDDIGIYKASNVSAALDAAGLPWPPNAYPTEMHVYRDTIDNLNNLQEGDTRTPDNIYLARAQGGKKWTFRQCFGGVDSEGSGILGELESHSTRLDALEETVGKEGEDGWNHSGLLNYGSDLLDDYISDIPWDDDGQGGMTCSLSVAYGDTVYSLSGTAVSTEDNADALFTQISVIVNSSEVGSRAAAALTAFYVDSDTEDNPITCNSYFSPGEVDGTEDDPQLVLEIDGSVEWIPLDWPKVIFGSGENAVTVTYKELFPYHGRSEGGTGLVAETARHAERLEDHESRISDLENAGSGDGTPIGTVIFFAGLSAPEKYLACDGTEYNITDYPALADFIADNYGSNNYFGGDGADTFCVPDWQGEFFRAAGANSHANQGSGGTVGEHQDGTSAPFLAIDGRDVNSPKLGYYTDDSTSGFAAVSNADKGAVVGGSALSFQRVNVDSKQTTSSRSNFYTARPTNTSLLVCIKAV